MERRVQMPKHADITGCASTLPFPCCLRYGALSPATTLCTIAWHAPVRCRRAPVPCLLPRRYENELALLRRQLLPDGGAPAPSANPANGTSPFAARIQMGGVAGGDPASLGHDGAAKAPSERPLLSNPLSDETASGKPPLRLKPMLAQNSQGSGGRSPAPLGQSPKQTGAGATPATSGGPSENQRGGAVSSGEANTAGGASCPPGMVSGHKRSAPGEEPMGAGGGGQRARREDRGEEMMGGKDGDDDGQQNTTSDGPGFWKSHGAMGPQSSQNPSHGQQVTTGSSGLTEQLTQRTGALVPYQLPPMPFPGSPHDMYSVMRGMEASGGVASPMMMMMPPELAHPVGRSPDTSALTAHSGGFPTPSAAAWLPFMAAQHPPMGPMGTLGPPGYPMGAPRIEAGSIPRKAAVARVDEAPTVDQDKVHESVLSACASSIHQPQQSTGTQQQVKKDRDRKAKPSSSPLSPQQPPPSQPPQQQPPARYTGDGWSTYHNPACPQGRAAQIELQHSWDHPSIICCVRYSSDGRMVATGCNHEANVYNAITGKHLWNLPHVRESSHARAPEAALSERSTQSVGNAKKGGAASAPDKEVDSYIRALCFSPDGKMLATGGEMNHIKVWSMESREVKDTLWGHQEDVFALEFSADGRLLASGSGDRTVKIWDMTSEEPEKECLHSLVNEGSTGDDGVVCLAMSPDMRYLVSGSLDRMLRIWDVETGKCLSILKGHTDSIYALDISVDGTNIVSGSLDRTLKLWSIASRQCKKTFKGHQDFVLSVAQPAEAWWIFSGSKDKTVNLWDVRYENSPVTTLQGHQNSVISIDTSSKGGTFVSGSGDGRARTWTYGSTSANSG
eukprot:jgi/Mesvir1/14288/Mv09718-RA.6